MILRPVAALLMAVALTGCSSGGKTAATPTPTASVTTLVGIGDSVPGALRCVSPCRSYVDVLGDLAGKALGRPVVAKNLGSNESMTAVVLLSYVQGDDEMRTAIKGASIITVTVGSNDWQGPCAFSGMATCLHDNGLSVQDSLGRILDEITTLRSGQPTAVRVTDYYDSQIASPQAAEQWGFAAGERAAFEKTYVTALAELNGLICSTAKAKGAVCVDLVAPFNGSSGNRDAGPLLVFDHIHPNEAGHQLIARTIADAGFAPVG